MWFTRDGLEQASGEALARHRATRYAGFAVVADLCCGIGGDLCALAPGRAALAVDHDPVHLRMARENARAHGAEEVAVACADVQSLRLPPSLAVFVDPARRAGGRRLPAGESRPPLAWCLGLADRVDAVGDQGRPRPPARARPHRLGGGAAGRPARAQGGGPVVAGAGHHDQQGDRLPRPPHPRGQARTGAACAPPGAYLLDPSPAVTRAGLVEELGRDLGAWKLDPRIAFLSADQPLRSPFGGPAGRGLAGLEPQAPPPGPARTGCRHRRGPQAPVGR